MDLKRLSSKAKEVVDKRGGTESVKEDAAELKDIFKGKGSLTDKAKEAAAAIKDPGAPGPDERAADTAAAAPAGPAKEHAHEREHRHEREHGRHGGDHRDEGPGGASPS
jgi:hypothetical protein